MWAAVRVPQSNRPWNNADSHKIYFASIKYMHAFGGIKYIQAKLAKQDWLQYENT